MFCRFCGKQLPEASKFCPGCGEPTLSAEPQTREDTLVQIYWAIFETWSAQVDSYWTRTNYFAALEVAAIAGSWVILHDDGMLGHRSLLITVDLAVALVLTAARIFSNLKSYDYHMYWWDALDEIEKGAGWTSMHPNYVSEHERRRRKRPRPILGLWSYRNFTNWTVPIAFLVIWATLVGLVWLRWC
jgi:hypothetical protein